jgi:hypothetical protein
MAEEEGAGNLAGMGKSIELMNGSMDCKRDPYNYIINADGERYNYGQERYA